MARDYAEADPAEDNARFLERPSLSWADMVQPLFDAGWKRDGGAEIGTVEIIAPDDQAGILIDNRLPSPGAETVKLWAGPPGWGTRAEAVFTARTPSHLIAATAAAAADSAPVMRERHQLHREVEHLVTLTPIDLTVPQGPRLPSPLDVRRAAVAQAVARAGRALPVAADLRVVAAHSRTAISPQNRSSKSQQTPGVRPVVSPPASRHGR